MVHVTTPKPPVQLDHLGGESELEDCLHLVRPCEAPGVNRVNTTDRDQIRRWRLGRGVVIGGTGHGRSAFSARCSDARGRHTDQSIARMEAHHHRTTWSTTA